MSCNRFMLASTTIFNFVFVTNNLAFFACVASGTTAQNQHRNVLKATNLLRESFEHNVFAF